MRREHRLDVLVPGTLRPWSEHEAGGKARRAEGRTGSALTKKVSGHSDGWGILISRPIIDIHALRHFTSNVPRLYTPALPSWNPGPRPVLDLPHLAIAYLPASHPRCKVLCLSSGESRPTPGGGHPNAVVVGKGSGGGRLGTTTGSSGIPNMPGANADLEGSRWVSDIGYLDLLVRSDLQ